MNSRKLDRCILLLFCIAVALAFFTALTTSITYLDYSDWGLLSRLPITYWAGIATIGLALLFSLRNSASLSIRASLAILFLVMLYVNFIPMFVEKPVGFSAFSLWPSSESNQVIATGHISVGKPQMLMDYTSWPFFTIFTSILRLVTGTPLILLSKWVPFFTLSLWGLLVFIILKAFLLPRYALIGAGLFLCGSWTRQQYFGPQSFAFSLFLLFLFLIIRQSNFGFGVNKRSFFVLAFITFIAALFSHALTSLFILLILLTSYVATRLFARYDSQKIKSPFIFCALCSIAMISYTIYVTPQFFNSAFNDVLNTFGTTAFQQFSRLPGSEFQQLTNASTYLLISLLAFVSFIALFQIIRKKIMPKLQIIFWISVLAVLVFVALLPYGQEGPFRAFIFGLPVFSFLSVYFLRDRTKLLSCFFMVILIAGIVALYGSDSYRLATEPELQGSKYCATYLPDGSITLYAFSPNLRFYDPIKPLKFVSLDGPPFSSYNASFIEASLNKTDIIVQSRNQRNYYEYYFGMDPFANIDLTGNPSLTVARVYDNGNFTVYNSARQR